MKRNLIALGSYLLLAVLRLTAQDTLPAIQQERYTFHIDTFALVIGDQTTLYIDDPQTFPSLEDLSNNGMVAVGQEYDTANKSLHTFITSFEPGEHWLHVGQDSIRITVNDVADVDTTTADIKDISGILRQPYTFWEIFRWILLALGIVVLIVGGIFLYRRYKEKKTLSLFAPKPVPPLPPHVRALQALEELRTQQLWQQGRVKEYYTVLTDIVRLYLEEAYDIPSAEMTSEQTLEGFRAAPAYSPEPYQRLHQILDTADMVKFAKSEPLPHTHDLCLANAVAFVKETAPTEPTSESDNQQ